MVNVYCPDCDRLLRIASVSTDNDMTITVDLECPSGDYDRTVEFNLAGVNVE